jgi:Anti-sigma-K factor rskA
MSREFDELVGDDLTPAERARLAEVHDMLVAAGPPPELPPALERPPARPVKSEIPYFPRRRWAAGALAAAAVAAVAFGVGYLIGHNPSEPAFSARAVVKMHATPTAPAGSRATLQLGHRDDAGNWPMVVNVSGLRELAKGGYYNLYLTKKGEPVVLCGSFVVSGDRTTVHYTEPYTLKHFDGWVVTRQDPGHHEPGPVVLET